MRVWIDILTPKQLLFFKPFIEDLKAKGHLTLVTSRRYREVEGLSGLMGVNPRYIGQHGGASRLGKLSASTERIHDLLDLVSDWAPDKAISFSSPECSRVAYGLGIQNICVNDSPHAENVARLTIPLCDSLATPWVIPNNAWIKFGIDKEKIIKYKALDPVAWLKRLNIQDFNIKNFEVDESKRTIAIRVEEGFAAYLIDMDPNWVTKVIDGILNKVEDCNILVLGRYTSQIEYLANKYGDRIIIPKEVFIGTTILTKVDIFVGMGGTMTAEASLLGVPSISAYQGKHLYTEEYLLSQGLLFRPGSPDAIANNVKELLRDHYFRDRLKIKSKRIMDKMEDPIAKLITIIEKK